MHEQSKIIMADLLKKYVHPEYKNLLDVGSLDVNGTYRSVIPESLQYVGLDIVAGET